MGRVTVEQVTPGTTRSLRQRVLRPDGVLPPDQGDSVHFAAWSATLVVGSASVRRELPPFPNELPGWRLRGMATEPEQRSQGVGRAVLDAVVAQVAAEGGGLLWCNARTPARQFYARAGFTSRGPEWVDPEIGPHVLMWRTVEPS